MSNSIQSRLLVSASFIVCCFLGLAGLVLDRAYQTGAQNALYERLQIHLYSVLAEAELTKNHQMVLRSALSDPRFRQVGSGLYVYVFDTNGDLVWRSSSSAGIDAFALENMETGVNRYQERRLAEQQGVELHYRAILESNTGGSRAFEFIIIESSEGVDSQISGFRSVLWRWLGGVGFLLMMAQFYIIRKSLKPLRLIVNDLEDIQQGHAQQLNNQYSDELKDIANTLNRLISNERSHLKRYRDTLSDLAHSLKTPLSVLSGLYTQHEWHKEDTQVLKIQTQQMRQLVDYQLQKAAAKGHQTLSNPLLIQPIVKQILDSLQKVYMDKNLSVSMHIDKDISFNAERGDMYELFGNLLDNAFKWSVSRVSININTVNGTEGHKAGLDIIIEDDGPGIHADELEAVLQRGMRADESVNGHGIGLAVVNDLVELYKGRLQSSKSSMDGQQWTIFLPTING